jgi:hypothetical protein
MSATPRNKLLVVGSSADSVSSSSRGGSSSSSGEHNITHPARFLASLMAGGEQREAEQDKQNHQGTPWANNDDAYIPSLFLNSHRLSRLVGPHQRPYRMFP